MLTDSDGIPFVTPEFRTKKEAAACVQEIEDRREIRMLASRDHSVETVRLAIAALRGTNE